MFDDRNKSNFVTICCWLSLLSLSARYGNVQALAIQKTNTHDNDIIHGELIGNGNGNSNSNINGNGNALQTDATVPNFSPRMEYNNEWRPVGRGDPLKNDPTYDYSPPALERVRYWRAENESKTETSNPKPYKKDYALSGKKDILLLGMPHERQRGQLVHSETSVLQPKYTSIRRSYYAHQHHLPTHLMPPPMQTLASPAHSMKTTSATEYRHSMPSSSSSLSSSSSSSAATTSMSMMHSKPFYSTSASSPWMHTSMPSLPTPMPSPSPSMMMHHFRQQSSSPYMHHDHDHHHQESISQFTYARPHSGTAFTPSNFIETNQNSLKPRKPWLHELLQKEIVKLPPKTPIHKYSPNYEQMSPSIGISTTHPPIAFVPLPTTTTPQSTTSTTTTRVFTTTSPVYFTTTMATPTPTPNVPHSAIPPVTPASTRLLIPTTSNLINRPTVTSMEMTTDALFKHYKQPVKPLLGPMYLIIEGHSKVKTYGKDELDPHRPKIVPIIPKREPVVRIADPNEKRGTLETFHVKHLHTSVTTPIAETTSSIPTTTTPMTAKSDAHTSSSVPTKSSTIDPTTETTTAKPPPTLTTTPKTIAQPLKDEKQQNISPPTTDAPTGMEGFFSFLDSSLGNLFHEEPTAPQSGENFTWSVPQNQMIFVTTPPTSTILHPVTINTTTATIKPPQIEARVGTQGSSIESLIDFEDEDARLENDKITTEPVPRDVRQVFDYDQLPELRLKDRMDVNVDEEDDNTDNDASEEGVIEMHDDSIEDIDMEDVAGLGNLTPDEYEDESHEIIKRIDRLVDDVDDDDGNEEAEFEELISAEVDSDDDLEMRHTKEA